MSSDKNYLSVGSWMLILIVVALPVIGWIMIIVWAITGENETRKNYFRAILAWFAVGTAAALLLIALMGIPQIQKKVQGWTQKGR